jgi:type III secretion protein Q
MKKPVPMPLALPSQKIDFTKIFNVLSRRAFASTFPLGTASAEVALMPVVPVFDSVVVTTVSVNGLNWQLGLDSDRFLAAHPVFDEPELEGTDPSALPVELKAALLETLLVPVLERVSEALGVTVSFVDVAFEPKVLSASFGLRMTLTGKIAERVQLAFVAPFAAAVDDLVSLLRVLPKRDTGLLSALLDEVPLTLSVCGGHTCVSEADYNALAVGDVVLPEQWLPADKRAQLRLMSGTRCVDQAHCQYEGDLLTFLDTWTGISENAMTKTDELEITLTFELDRKTVTVGDLKSIQAGYTFPMTNTTQAPVTILANGKPVARGRLVDLNGVIGVQVTDAE